MIRPMYGYFVFSPSSPCFAHSWSGECQDGAVPFIPPYLLRYPGPDARVSVHGLAALRIDFRDGHVLVNSGEMYVVPKGVEHKTSAEKTVKVMIEPCGVLNTGHEGGERTAENDVWI